jgi:N-methylhydantoinase B
MLGMREHVPISGIAGGSPGSRTSFGIVGSDGTERPVPTNAANVALQADEAFVFRVGSGGGFGDPLDRDPAAVGEDVRLGALSASDAGEIYGVVLTGEHAVDVASTSACRDARRRGRLAAAGPAVDPAPAPVATADLGGARAIYPGVVALGGRAYAQDSGARLGAAPGHWTDGCPTLEEPLAGRTIRRTYLDPITGAALAVEAVPDTGGRSFTTAPAWWDANGAPSNQEDMT